MAFHGDRYPTGEILSYVLANGTRHRYGRTWIFLEDGRNNVEAGDLVEIFIGVSSRDGVEKGRIREVWRVDSVEPQTTPYRIRTKKYKFVREVPGE